MIDRPSLRQLEYAVAVADHRSFHRAASACGVSQPGLSIQLRELEGMLGVVLFERTPVLPTPAGRALVERARDLLNATDDLVRGVRVFEEPLSGPLALGVIPTIAPYLLPKVLPATRRRYPRLRLTLREGETADLVGRTARGELDVSLLALEADLGSLETIALFRDEFQLAVPKGHRLAKRRFVRPSQIGGEQALLLDDGHCLRDQALEVCDRAGATEVGDVRATSLATLAEMVASGLGVTLIPEMAIRALATRSDLVVHPFSRPRPGRTIGLAWRPGDPRSRELRLLGETLRNP